MLITSNNTAQNAVLMGSSLKNTKNELHAVTAQTSKTVGELVTDIIDIKNPHLMDQANHVHVLDAGSDQKAYLVFSETTGNVSASLITKDGESVGIAAENCPKEFSAIKTVDSFNGFMQNAQARVAIMSDGEPKLYVMQKGLGGMPPKKEDLTKPITGPSTPQAPGSINIGSDGETTVFSIKGFF